MNTVRNFCIIAHIDHGKSTLADRFLEITNTVSKREMKAQMLDQMDIERERGITIKLQPVRMEYTIDGCPYIFNLIDTPGHVDFTYEVSRSLAAVEGALLLVDATQGIQAQTLANLYLALDQNLTIIPVINKIDLASARIEETIAEITSLLGCPEEDIAQVSAKTGKGASELLYTIATRIPPPRNSNEHALRALIFDSVYDEYRGVVGYVRIFGGELARHAHLQLKSTASKTQALDVGYFRPKYESASLLTAGEIGYVVTGLKNVRECRVGDTIIDVRHPETPALGGYADIKPMVFAGIFPKDGDEFKRLSDGIEKLKANDSALQYEPEHSPALGFGFRCGFLGLLHLEVIQERLKREHQIDLVVTVPSVAYRVIDRSSHPRIIRSPLEFPSEETEIHIEEPWVRVDIVSPEKYIGSLMTLASEKRGLYKNTEYISMRAALEGNRRVILHFEMPLASILVDFYDALKSASAGFASLNYELMDYRKADVVRLDILVAGERILSLSSIVYRDTAYLSGRRIVSTLKDILPRRQFEIKLQAALGAKIIASDRIAPLRKDVTAKLYGGDVTRKQKLLEKQKKGKKRMQNIGHVEIPTEAYLKVLKR